MARRLAKIPVTIVTGFLGAGKTTLIRHVLAHARGRRLALVINEFGDVGVDGDILEIAASTPAPRSNIVELANGCLCCTVADDFLPAIEGLLAREPRPITSLIETSGLALPKPLVKAFDWPEIRAKLTVDGVIAVVDAAAVADGRFADDEEKLAAQRAQDPSLDHDNPLEEVYEDQLLCADLILLNKSDLLRSRARKGAGEIAAQVPRAVKIVATHEGRIGHRCAARPRRRGRRRYSARPSHHDAEEGHDHDDFDTFVLTLEPVADPAALSEKLSGIARDHDVLRMKGFVEVAGKPMRLLVQGVGARFSHQFDRPWRADEARAGRLVVIGQKGAWACAAGRREGNPGRHFAYPCAPELGT